MSQLPAEQAQLIRQAYVEVQRYNSAVETERAKVARGLGHMDSEIRRLAEVARTALQEASKTLPADP